MQIPLLSGIIADEAAEFRVSLPVNLEPVFVDSGISKGYLRSSAGISEFGTGPGEDRGAIVWNGVLYRVMGTKLVSVSDAGAVTVLGDVGAGGTVTMDYSFGLLAIASGGRLYYFDGTTVAQVTDPDLGTVIDVMFIDGRFMTTDGTSLVLTELSDPYAVDPLKYGSSEVDPDPVNGLVKIRGEAYALNANTIENFRNIGGNGFPYQRNSGAMIPKGCVGTYAKAYFLETFAFVGSGRNEAISVYLAGAGQALPIGTAEIDDELAALTDAEQAAIVCEARNEKAEQRLYVHLPDKTLVYLNQASKQQGEPVWHVLASGAGADQQYVARNFTLAYGKWVCADADGAIGVLDNTVETHFGEVAGWRFDTAFLYNESRGGIIHQIELVGLPGRAPFGADPKVFLSYTKDGETWSNEFAVSMGTQGQRQTRVQWLPGIWFSNYLGLRFRGANTAMASWARCEGRLEGLAV